MKPGLLRRPVSEFLGTLFLLATFVGSGIMGEKLAGGNTAIALLANTIATGAALIALIFTFGPISGAHFNPAVTLADAWQRDMAWREVPAYLAAQVAGAFAGVATAHAMFGLPVYSVLKTSPESMPAMISAYEALNAQRRQVAIAGAPGNLATDAMTSLYWHNYLPNAILLHAVGGAPQQQLSKTLPLVATLRMQDDKATAYVCRNYVCNAPTTDPAVMQKLLLTNRLP